MAVEVIGEVQVYDIGYFTMVCWPVGGFAIGNGFVVAPLEDCRQSSTSSGSYS